MRSLIAMVVLSLALGAACAADTDKADKNEIRKGFGGFSATLRGNVRLDQSSGAPAVYVEQAGGSAIRILTDSIDEWKALDGRPASVKGDVVLFGGQPVMVVRKAIPRKEKVGAANANFDVQGRLLITPSGDAAIKTRDGFVRVGNPEIVSRLKELGVGAKVKVKGILAAANGGMILNAASMREDKGDSHRRSGGGLKLGSKPKQGQAGSLALALGGQSKTDDAEKVTLKKPRKKVRRAANIWDTHKKVVTIGQHNQ